MWKPLKTGDVRRFYPESKLREMAEGMFDTLVVRDWDRTGSIDTRRPSTEMEKRVLREIAFGALLGLNDSNAVRSSRDLEQVILDTTEYIARRFLPSINNYDTIYLPLKAAINDWELETNA